MRGLFLPYKRPSILKHLTYFSPYLIPDMRWPVSWLLGSKKQRISLWIFLIYWTLHNLHKGINYYLNNWFSKKDLQQYIYFSKWDHEILIVFFSCIFRWASLDCIFKYLQEIPILIMLEIKIRRVLYYTFFFLT